MSNEIPKTKCPLSGEFCECPLLKIQKSDILADELNTAKEKILEIDKKIFNPITGRSAGFFKTIILEIKKKGYLIIYNGKQKKAGNNCSILEK